MFIPPFLFVVFLSVFFTGYHNNGKARAPDDYHNVSKRIHFPVGIGSVTEQVTIVDDDIGERIETFWVGLREPIGGKLGEIDSAVVTLVDDQSELLALQFGFRNLHIPCEFCRWKV